MDGTELWCLHIAATFFNLFCSRPCLRRSGRSQATDDPEYLASLALGHLRAKTPQLRLALEGKIRPHHRFLLRRLLDQLRFVEHEIVLLDERLEFPMASVVPLIPLWDAKTLAIPIRPKQQKLRPPSPRVSVRMTSLCALD